MDAGRLRLYDAFESWNELRSALKGLLRAAISKSRDHPEPGGQEQVLTFANEDVYPH